MTTFVFSGRHSKIPAECDGQAPFLDPIDLVITRRKLAFFFCLPHLPLKRKVFMPVNDYEKLAHHLFDTYHTRLLTPELDPCWQEKCRYYFNLVLKENPNNVPVLAKFAQLSKPKRALEYLNRALELEPENGAVLFQKAQFLVNEMEDDVAAELLLQKFLHLQPHHTQAMFLLAEIWERRAKESIEKEMPSDSAKLVELAEEFFSHKENQAAITCLDRATELEPDNQALWFTKYWLLRGNEQDEKALSIPAEKLPFKYTISFEEFLRTGEYGPLRLGMSKQEVWELLGPPTWCDFDYSFIPGYPGKLSPDKQKFTQLHPFAFHCWGYSFEELYFGPERGLLYFISAKNFRWWRGGANMVFDINPHFDPFLEVETRDLRKSEWELWLKAAGIPYTIKLLSSEFKTGSLWLSSGVELLYGYEEDEKADIVAGLEHINYQFSDLPQSWWR